MPFCSQVSANTQITTVTVFDIKRNSRKWKGGGPAVTAYFHHWQQLKFCSNDFIRQQPFIYFGGWDFHCARRFFFRTFLNQNIFFSWEGKQKIVFLSCGTEIHFSIKTIHWLLIFSTAIFLFLAGDSIIFFLSYNAKSNIFFRSTRALKYFFPKKYQPPHDPPLPPRIRKWLLPSMKQKNGGGTIS